MRLIVGLGNPGRIYINVRHNIGFSVVKTLAKIYRIGLKKDRATFSLSGKGRIEGKPVILSLPLTFMNRSGVSVKALLEKHKLCLADLLVVCDNLDLEFGRLKIKAAGSSGGHRGLNSLIDSLKTTDFCRLRIGIGRPSKNSAATDYVLAPFTMKEKKQLKTIISEALDCCRIWVSEGINKSMEVFNRRGRQ
jgi:PTH1 family peptidyl-tRNA hydrolase